MKFKDILLYIVVFIGVIFMIFLFVKTAIDIIMPDADTETKLWVVAARCFYFWIDWKLIKYLL